VIIGHIVTPGTIYLLWSFRQFLYFLINGSNKCAKHSWNISFLHVCSFAAGVHVSYMWEYPTSRSASIKMLLYPKFVDFVVYQLCHMLASLLSPQVRCMNHHSLSPLSLPRYQRQRILIIKRYPYLDFHYYCPLYRLHHNKNADGGNAKSHMIMSLMKIMVRKMMSTKRGSEQA